MVTTCEMQLHLSEGERRKIGVSFSAVSLEEGPQTSKSSEEETMIPQASMNEVQVNDQPIALDDITMAEKHDAVILDVMESLIQFTVEIGDAVVQYVC